MFLAKTLLALALAAAQVANAATTFYHGHDLSSLVLMETTQHATWYSLNGTNSTADVILGAGGMNSVRLRQWVNPVDGVYGLDYNLALATRLQKQGFSIYLDFHFSDSWADPTKQYIPAAWPSDLASLSSTLRSYVSSTLESFHTSGIDLEIVSLGNEITNGMLWPTGKIVDNDFTNFATLFAAARQGVDDAVSAGVTKPLIMIHIDDGYNESLQTNWYASFLGTGTVSTADWDVFGVSFYPFYGTNATLDNLAASLAALTSTYQKPAIVAETDWPDDCEDVALSEPSVPISAAGQTEWVKDVIGVLDGVAGGLGQGVFYWEPAYLNNTSLGSNCSDAILFDVDWSRWPITTATARTSVNMYQS